MVDKQRAITLRSQGWKYDDIAKELNCSVSWCKQHLSSVLVVKDFTNRELYLMTRDLLQEIEQRIQNERV